MAERKLSFEQELDHDYKKWIEDVERLETAIAQVGRHDLEVLVRAGVDRKGLLTLLALATTDSRKTLLRLMRQRQAALGSLSRRMDTIAAEAKERINDPLSVVQFWAFMNGGNALGMHFPKAMADDPGAEFIVAGMRTMAKMLKDQARRFGQYLKTWGKTDIGVALLLARYRMYSPKMSHLEELARLLTDAFEAAGKNRSFSADGLRKTYKRRGTRLLAMWITFNTPASPTPPLEVPPIIGQSNLGRSPILDKSRS